MDDSEGKRPGNPKDIISPVLKIPGTLMSPATFGDLLRMIFGDAMRLTLRRMFVLVALFGCGLALLRGCYFVLTHVESGEGVPSVSWWPESASNVSYYYF